MARPGLAACVAREPGDLRAPCRHLTPEGTWRAAAGKLNKLKDACNAAYWIDEFHLDGLRLDTAQNIHDFADAGDESHEHVLALLTRKAREAAGDRPIFVVGENEPQTMRLIRPRQEGGLGLDVLWSDGFHHSAMVTLTGRNEAYYTDYRGSPQELLSAMKRGFLYQGQRYRWQG